ncbi:MAG: hypothetical protein GX638_07205, partial [Crenarchaeota archaeon]|nr:hypothetical protein [Thermoproteota archaeon]
QSNSGKFAEGINPNDLGVSVLAHLAFTHFCRNQDDHRILEIIKEIPTGVPLTVTDSFSIALILLSNPDWKLICEEKIKLDTQSLMERLNRAKKSNKSHEIAYAYTLLGLSLFPHDIENAFNFMEKAINFAQVAYRMDQFPLIFLIYANMIMKLVPRNLRNTQRLKQILETLEKRFAWHEIPLYLSEYRMLRLEFLVEDFVSDKNFKMAEELDMLLRSNTLIEAHYFNRLEICKRKMVYFRNSY